MFHINFIMSQKVERPTYISKTIFFTYSYTIHIRVAIQYLQKKTTECPNNWERSSVLTDLRNTRAIGWFCVSFLSQCFKINLSSAQIRHFVLVPHQGLDYRFKNRTALEVIHQVVTLEIIISLFDLIVTADTSRTYYLRADLDEPLHDFTMYISKIVQKKLLLSNWSRFFTASGRRYALASHR